MNKIFLYSISILLLIILLVSLYYNYSFQKNNTELKEQLNVSQKVSEDLQNKVNSANEMSGNVLLYINSTQKSCPTQSSFSDISDCLKNLVQENNDVPNIRDGGFSNYWPPDMLEGQIILINDGEKSLNSSKFKLFLNKELKDESCKNSGMIDKGYSCVLNFYKSCDRGDTLTVEYEGKRVYIMNC